MSELPIPREELRALVREMLREAVDSRVREAAAPATPTAVATPPPAAPAVASAPVSAPPPDGIRIASGAVTESSIMAAARAGGRLVVGPKVVITPLARDRAREIGVTIEREEP